MTTVKQLMIVADDVTGAADSAARAHRAGLAATIDVQPQKSLPSTSAAVQAVALSTDSRFLAPAAAARQVTTLLQPLVAEQAHQATLWYKKIDSTLRGNIGAELAALLPLLTPANLIPCAVICPAFPAQGRGLVGGTLVYADAPPHPPHLPTLLAAQTVLPLATVGLDVVRAGVAALQATLTALREQGVQLLVVDGVTDADLATICQAALALPHLLLCGSAGLVGEVAAVLAASSGMAPPPVAPPPLLRPILAVVGSGSPMAHRQLAALRTQTTTTLVALDPTLSAHAQFATLDTAADLLLHLPLPPPDQPLEGSMARHAVELLTTVAQFVVAAQPPATLLIVGGDTAIHLLSGLGIDQLQVEAELWPGIPRCRGVDRAGRTVTVILKAGNHGDAATLVTLYQGLTYLYSA